MAFPVRYGKILEELRSPSRQVADGLPLQFEIYDIRLSHDHWLLGMFCLLSLRPVNKELATILWSYVRSSVEDVKTYIYNFARDTYLDLIYAGTHESKTVNLSRSHRREKNSAYKGIIIGINMKTYAQTECVGKEEILALGFSPGRVYDIINDKPGKYTHRGHTFVRLEDS